MDKRSIYRQKLYPYEVLVAGYFIITLIGAFLLGSPPAVKNGQWQSFIDSFFMASSGISTTGLSVVDIGRDYTLFGQIVLLAIFQIGGLGYMTFIIFFMYILGVKSDLWTQIVAKESLSGTNLRILGKLFFSAMILTIISEFIGALILSLFWIGRFSILSSLFLGTFHSVSAFCTAGFCLFSDSLIGYQNSVIVNLTISILSLLGGIGFVVLFDLLSYFKNKSSKTGNRQLTVHTKFVLLITTVIICVSAIFLIAAGKWGSETTLGQRFQYSFFQVISASTTDGFNTIDIKEMNNVSMVLIMILMFIGASPGSTGGGIKTSTAGVICLFVLSIINGGENVTVNVFKRKISNDAVNKSMGVFMLFMLFIVVNLLILTITEKGTFLQILFEIVSALGNAGLSTGITSGLSNTGKIVLSVTMFVGRIGPLTLGFLIMSRKKPRSLKCPEEEIYIG